MKILYYLKCIKSTFFHDLAVKKPFFGGKRTFFGLKSRNFLNLLIISTNLKFKALLTDGEKKVILILSIIYCRGKKTMTNKEWEKFKRLDEIFDFNFQLTRLYKSYLENFPEIITKDAIKELCADGTIELKDAIAALLCEIFGIDTMRSAEDRRFMRDYIYPSIRILDAKRYTEDPYYKNVKIKNIKDGRWELKWESYAPFRGVICDDMVVCEDMREYAPLGFFEEKFDFPAVLEDGNEWMTLTPVDMDTCRDAIARSRGRVVTFGLGLGYFAYMAALKDEVESVTVVELSEDVIRLFKTHILPYFPGPEKIKLVNADAFEYAERVMPQESFDFAFVDTWRDAGDGAPMYRRMKALEHLCEKTEFSYWIEGFLISRLRAEKYAILREKLNTGADLSYESAVEELKSIP